MIRNVTVLFVDPLGPYPRLVKDWYDEIRDARTYDGPNPVVAHPPCHLWVNLACVNFKRYGGEHNRPGNDGGCFKQALDAVRTFGGVLEHPAGSRAWAEYDLERPKVPRTWNRVSKNEWVCEVWQSAYGHKARKRTWLLYVGKRVPLPANWRRKAGTHQCGWFDRIKPTLGKKEASRTPAAFAQYLVSLAQQARLK